MMKYFICITPLSLLFSTALLQQKCQINAFCTTSLLSPPAIVGEATRDIVFTSCSPIEKAICHRDSNGRLFAGSDDSSKSSYDRNVERTCLRRFLTQRSVQSFMFLCQECRDPHTIRWLNEFGNTTDLEQYHGTGAIDYNLFKSWDSYFSQMVDKPDDFMTVSARRRGGGVGGWSKNNPYLKDRFVEFRIDIRPSSLVTRILAVREQLAREWIQDLGVVIRMQNEIMDSYFENVIRKRDEEEERSDEEETRSDLDNIDSEQLSKDTGGGTGKLYSSDPGDPSRKPSFNRNAVILLRNSIAFEEHNSSPLRMGTFDLLMLLATHESIHRVLRNFKKDGSQSRLMYEWFRDFYVKRAAEFFDGSQNTGRADDFLEELLLTPPTVKKGDGKTSSIIDPLGLAETLIRTRIDVAHEWKEILLETPNDHIGLRRQLLTRQVLGSTKEADQIIGEDDLGSFM